MVHLLLVPKLESHNPPLTSGLYSLYQSFTQHSKVLQDGFYVGHHHKLPTLRHHHASLYVGGLKNQKIQLSSRVTKAHPEMQRWEQHSQMSPYIHLTQATGNADPQRAS